VRVGVAGALGRLGRVACTAIEAAEDLTVSAAFARHAGVALADAIPGFGSGPATATDGAGGPVATSRAGVVTDDQLAVFLARGLDVVVDCTVQPASAEVARAAVGAGIPVVIGASGWSDDELAALAKLCAENDVPAMWVPNFSLGAVLMMRFAAQAARVMPRAEIVELHHDAKRDAPSGTAKLTARRIEEAGAPPPPVHSVRLPGLLAHQETIFGGTGETLTLRHDSLSRESFGPGIVAAVRAVRSQRGLVIGLDGLVDDLIRASSANGARAGATAGAPGGGARAAGPSGAGTNTPAASEKNESKPPWINVQWPKR
jgi:4-hydroxy-tetrahydrodipicolinate reductase